MADIRLVAELFGYILKCVIAGVDAEDENNI